MEVVSIDKKSVSVTATYKGIGGRSTTRALVLKKGETATNRRVQVVGGVSVKDQFALFPKKPGKKMAYVAGLPKPHGCV